MFRGSTTPSINCPGILSVSETVFIVIYRHYTHPSSADHNFRTFPLLYILIHIDYRSHNNNHAQTEEKERGILQYFGLKALNNMLILNLFEFKIERSIMFL